MRKSFFGICFGLLSLFSCQPEDCVRELEYIEWSPIYMTIEQMRNEIRLDPPKENKNPGKIYVYGTLLLVNEINKGIHLIDNAHPTAPVQLGFISIQGNVDMAMEGQMLYADNYANLLTIDLTNVRQPQLKDIKTELFTLYGKTGDGKYLVRYDQKLVRRTVPCEQDPIFWLEGDFVYTTTSAGSKKVNSPSVAGIGGSFARFTLVDNYLYVINHNQLISFDVSNPAHPLHCASETVSWDIETIFPYKNFLFIGARSGMYIFGLTNPKRPHFISKFVHANGCDPVYVADEIAYITLRNGTACNGFTNQLDIVQVKDPVNPQKLAIHSMVHPHGLAVDGDLLVLCEGTHGFKTIALLPNAELQNLAFITNHAAYDVILISRDHAIIIGEDGLYQYDLSHPESPRLMSKLF